MFIVLKRLVITRTPLINLREFVGFFFPSEAANLDGRAVNHYGKQTISKPATSPHSEFS